MLRFFKNSPFHFIIFAEEIYNNLELVIEARHRQFGHQQNFGDLLKQYTIGRLVNYDN